MPSTASPRRCTSPGPDSAIRSVSVGVRLRTVEPFDWCEHSARRRVVKAGTQPGELLRREQVRGAIERLQQRAVSQRLDTSESPSGAHVAHRSRLFVSHLRSADAFRSSTVVNRERRGAPSRRCAYRPNTARRDQGSSRPDRLRGRRGRGARQRSRARSVRHKPVAWTTMTGVTSAVLEDGALAEPRRRDPVTVRGTARCEPARPVLPVSGRRAARRARSPHPAAGRHRAMHAPRRG